MYLPKSKYRIKTPPPGTYQNAEGVEYTGPIIETASGQVYAGDSISSPGPLLFLTQEISIPEVPIPFNEYLPPTEEDYRAGSYTRLLLRNSVTKRVVEVGRRQFEEKRNLPNIQALQVQWLLVGEVEDRQMSGPVTIKGVRTRNQQTIETLKAEYPGIEIFLNDPLEFVI